MSQSSNTWIFFIWSALISGFIFSTPTNLFLKCCQNFGYVKGLFVDYLIPKFYLTNLVAMVLILLWAISNRQRIFHKFKLLWQSRRLPMTANFWLILTTLGLWVAIGFRQMLVPNQVAALWWYEQATLVIVTGLVLIDIVRQIELSKYSYRFWQTITLILAITIIFQSSLAIYQSTQQKSLAGYWLLGEPSLSHPIGLAKTVTNAGEVRILPYGTTAHPNVLAGSISLYLILMYLIRVRRKPLTNQIWWPIWTICLLLGCITIWLTQSISGMLALAIGLTLLFVTFRRHSKPAHQPRHAVPIKSGSASRIYRLAISILIVTFITFIFILIPITIHVLAEQQTDNLSLVRRDRLQSIAIMTTIEQPLFGLGLNNFTVQMEQYGQNAEQVRFVQPVHHVGWLWISETGILGFIFVISLMATILNRASQPTKLTKPLAFCFLTLAPILVLDHYLLSLPSGMMMLTIFLILSSILIAKSNS